jgi:hypothetical protein
LNDNWSVTMICNSDKSGTPTVQICSKHLPVLQMVLRTILEPYFELIKQQERGLLGKLMPFSWKIYFLPFIKLERPITFWTFRPLQVSLYDEKAGLLSWWEVLTPYSAQPSTPRITFDHLVARSYSIHSLLPSTSRNCLLQLQLEDMSIHPWTVKLEGKLVCGQAMTYVEEWRYSSTHS